MEYDIDDSIIKSKLLSASLKNYNFKIIDQKTIGISFDHKLTEDELNQLLIYIDLTLYKYMQKVRKG